MIKQKIQNNKPISHNASWMYWWHFSFDLSIKFPFFPNLRNEFLKLIIYSQDNHLTKRCKLFQVWNPSETLEWGVIHEFYAISKSSWVLCNIKTLSLIKHQTLVHSFLKLNINKKVFKYLKQRHQESCLQDVKNLRIPPFFFITEAWLRSYVKN